MALIQDLFAILTQRVLPGTVKAGSIAQRLRLLDTEDIGSPAAGSIGARIKTIDEKLAGADFSLLNASVSSRAPGATALSTAQWTNGRATLLDNLSRLDRNISLTATPTDVDSQIHSRLNIAVPTNPVADSLYERIKTLDDAYTSVRAAKLDKLDTVPVDVWTYGTRTLTSAPSIVKSIQHLSATMSTGTVDVSITAVTVNKSFIVTNFSFYKLSGAGTTFGNISARLLNSTTVRVENTGTGTFGSNSGGTCRFSVIEYF
jgi:hypothetical protein